MFIFNYDPRGRMGHKWEEVDLHKRIKRRKSLVKNWNKWGLMVSIRICADHFKGLYLRYNLLYWIFCADNIKLIWTELWLLKLRWPLVFIFIFIKQTCFLSNHLFLNVYMVPGNVCIANVFENKQFFNSNKA